MKNKIKEKVMIVIFTIIILLPMFLQLMSQLSQKRLDVVMNGYFDNFEKKEFTIATFTSGEFQNDYESWLTNSFKPRNVYIKIYNQLQYTLFDLSNRIVGKDNDFFEYPYIAEELCLEGLDYNDENKDAEMQEYINDIECVNRKLKAFGKKFIIFSTSSKGYWNQENIPNCYRIQAKKDGKKAIESFREKIASTDVLYYDADILAEKSEYPLFYKTGIHWARPIEQEVSCDLVAFMNKEWNMNYKLITLGDVNSSKNPYWRDADVFGLANLIFPAEEEMYYEYDITKESPYKYDKMRVLLQGGSYALGFVKDYFDTYSNAEVYDIFYDSYITMDNNQMVEFDTWDDLDLQYCLDQTDVVMIEVNESVVSNYSNDFIAYLNRFLDTYTPNKSEERLADKNLDTTLKTGLLYADGYYGYEEDHVWATKDSSVTLQNENITKFGLELAFSVNENTLTDGAYDIAIYVNQNLVKKLEVDSTDDYIINISPDELNKINKNDRYDIEIICEKDFNPAAIGLSSDNRDLAVDVTYIGETR